MDPLASLREVEKILRLECSLHQRYLDLLEQERKLVVEGNHHRVTNLTEQRQSLSEEMDSAHQERKAWMEKFPGGRDMRVTEVIKRNFRSSETRVALELAHKLRELVVALRKSSTEFTLVVNNTLTLVNGTLSILLSAAQHVVRSYSSQGQLREQFHPVSQHVGTIVKQA